LFEQRAINLSQMTPPKFFLNNRPYGQFNFNFKRSYFSLAMDAIKILLFKMITHKSCNLFLRAGDFISSRPLLTGLHEPKITRLIDHFSMAGYHDFLIDIGANIGLTSCQNGQSFKKIFMYEPNPLCFKILEVNTIIALKNKNYKLFNYGLGKGNRVINLSVPLTNWGGAFIKDKYNIYSNEILYKKDGFLDFRKKNYSDIQIKLRDSTKELKKVFNFLIKRKLTAGVIKIDVEGYEPIILTGIAQSIPKACKVVIIFESLNPKFDIKAILKCFLGRATAYKLQSNRELKNNNSYVDYMDYFKLKLRDRLDGNSSGNWSGDIVLFVDSL
jgi:FkbM family methyltransferase